MLISFFKYQKSILTNFKKPGPIFCLLPFSNVKKSIFTNLKNPGPIFCLPPFSNIKKVYLQISKYPFHANNNFKGNNLHKNHYTNNSHKNHYEHKAKIYNYCMYTQITIKKFPHHTIIKKLICSLNIRMVNQRLNLSLNELRIIAEHGNVRDYENKSAKDFIKAMRVKTKVWN